MKVAIIGAGISGLVCAHLLHADHEITVFERDSHIGGHSNTVCIQHEGRHLSVDTGFIVYNERNYPLFTRLLHRLGVATAPTTMSFSVRDDRDGLEYGGGSLGALFAQRTNIVRPKFHRLVRGILRFYREAERLIAEGPEDITLGEFLERHGFAGDIARQFIVPMGAAIWSSGTLQMLDFPARFFVRFFANHGMLSTKNRPQWRTVIGGSREYVSRLVIPFRDRIRLDEPVQRVARHDAHVEVTTEHGTARFDEVILACHSDEALALLHDASDAEREILSALPYQENDAVLHSDRSLLPRRPRAWSAWNYRLTGETEPRAFVTYNLSILQHLGTQEPICVTLNQTDQIDRAKIFSHITYHHPVYTVPGMRARSRHGDISGVRNTHYCGAYWYNGFHEDGVRSAARVCARFGANL